MAAGQSDGVADLGITEIAGFLFLPIIDLTKRPVAA
jgi:hypothetical protein